MTKLEKALAAMRASQSSVSFDDARRVCEHYFGEPRQSSGSHVVFAMPWAGDPRVNIQNKGGQAKPYQVKQALQAIDRLEAEAVARIKAESVTKEGEVR